MPIYEYFCPSCDWDGDLISSLEKRDDQECPQCTSELLRSIINQGTSFTLKGGGWFKDGYSKCDKGGGT